MVLGILVPLLAAWVVTKRRSGKPGVRQLFSGLNPRRAPLGWLALALVTAGVLLTAPLLIHRFLGGSGPIWYPPQNVGALVGGLVVSIGEEVGWRGFAQPRLSEKFALLGGSALLGCVWAVWHIPMFLGADVPFGIYPAMLVYFVAGSIVFGWLYERSGQNLLVAVAAHLGAHLNNSHQALPDETPALLHTAAWVIAAALLVAFDKKTFQSSAAARQK